MEGIIIVDKPQGWTSFDVVAKIRDLSRDLPAGRQGKKVGHSGTLDPMATGLLPVFLGKATKSIQYFMEGDKGYEGEMTLGARSDTGDADGKIIMTNYELRITNEGIINIFKKYTGEIEQVPPMYSAKKVNGKKLYELARKGIEIKREPRRIKIYTLRFLEPLVTKDLTQQPNRPPYPNPISFYVECSKGTYVRQLVMDIGDDLGCGAYLSALRRVYAHPFHISQAITMETIINLAKIGKLETVVIPVENVLNSKKENSNTYYP